MEEIKNMKNRIWFSFYFCTALVLHKNHLLRLNFLSINCNLKLLPGVLPSTFWTRSKTANLLNKVCSDTKLNISQQSCVLRRYFKHI